jgi:hypothetical protein
VTVADQPEESEETSGGGVKSPVEEGTRIPWVVGAVFIVVTLGIGLAIGPKSKNPPPAPGARVLVVPTHDQMRRVVVPPCGTKLRVSAQNVAEQLQTQGVTTVALPRGTGRRVVAVPRCPGQMGFLPGAIYVLKPGTPTPTEKSSVGGLGSIRSLLVVPDGSELKTLVVAPCDKGGASVRKSVVLTSEGAPPADTAVAPKC